MVILLFGCSRGAAAAPLASPSCDNAASYVDAHARVDTELQQRIATHSDIYAKDTSSLTPQDVLVIEADIEFYITKLAELTPPDGARGVWLAEIAYYSTLAVSIITAVNGDATSSQYQTAATPLGEALAQQRSDLVLSCPAYAPIYGATQQG